MHPEKKTKEIFIYSTLILFGLVGSYGRYM